VHEPRYSVATFMTPHNTILEDIEQVARVGADGIGLWEAKFGSTSDGELADALATAGLRASFCLPRVWTILPGPVDAPAERDLQRRADAICASIARLAALDPVGIVVGPGSSGDPARPAGPLEAVAEKLVLIADTAAEHGQRVAFEILARRRGCPIRSIDELAALVDATGRRNVDLFLDVWHSWSDPGVHDQLARHAGRVACLQVNDVRYEERSWADRALPGEGRAVCARFVAALVRGGFDGWFELEVLSDDGTYGTPLPDSLWRLPHEELLRRGRAAFERVWREAASLAGPQH